MGLLTEIVLLPLAPVRFTGWIARQVADEADRERFSSGAAVRRLAEIEEASERGEIGEEEEAALQGQVLGQVAGAPDAGEEQEADRDG